MFAMGLSLAAALLTAGLSEFFDHLDGGFYAEDIIRMAIARV